MHSSLPRHCIARWHTVFSLSLAIVAFLLVAGIRSTEAQRAPSFPSVHDDYVYADAVAHAYGRGIVRGYPDGTFRPESPINGAEFVKILLRANFPDVSSNSACLDQGLLRFQDVPVDAWFANYVCIASNYELL